MRHSDPVPGEVSENPHARPTAASIGSTSNLDKMIPDMLEIATRRERLSSTSAPPERVDLVSALGELAHHILGHNQNVLTGNGTEDWAALAEQLAATASWCRRQTVIRLTNIGDSGSR